MVLAKVLSDLLQAHVYQEEQPPGLYPTQPTVCSCGATPPTRPEEGDDVWWANHVAALIKEM